jgi:hypothetical protein
MKVTGYIVIDQIGCETQHWYINLTNASGLRIEESIGSTKMSVSLPVSGRNLKRKYHLGMEYFALEGDVSSMCLKRR